MFPVVGEIFDRHPDLWKAVRLEGNYRGPGVHAAGLVITNRPIAEVCAQYTRTKKGQNGEPDITTTVVSVDKKDGEYLNLMKADLLGLSTMGMIRIAIDLAGVSLEELYALPLDDPKVIEAFTRNDVVGIFQFEGRATRLVGREVRPDDFGEMVDINGLSRPGPLFSGTTADYIDIKHGKKTAEKLHPIWDRITAPTKGQVIYQEQVLAALKEIGKIPVTRVGEIRRIISQKLGEAQFNESAGDFVTGAATLGINRDTAMHMWGRLVTSATYSFVYAHSASYAIIGYWAMWLKIYYPVEFYTAALRKSDKDNWTTLIKDANRHGVKVLGAHPGISEDDWTATEELLFESSGDVIGTKQRVVRAGLLQIPGIGPSKAAAVRSYREGVRLLAPPSVRSIALDNLEPKDLINVKGIGPKMMEGILAIDPADPFGLHRIERIMTRVREAISTGELPLSVPTHTSDEVLDAKGGSRVVWTGFVRKKEFKDYIEDERARTGDDLDEIKARMKDPHLPTGCVLHCYDDGDEDVYVRVHRRTFPRFRQDLEDINPDHHVILAVGKKSNNSFGASIYVDRLYYFDPQE
jgi:DNA polymerase-3 subunit alpha